LDFSSPAWLAEAKQLQHLIHHHLEEEEREVFQLAGKILSSTEKTELAAAYLKEINQQREKLAA
jgi:hemerythrin-like domain-containing protein